MYGEMNTPIRSKTNWTAIAQQLIMVAFLAGVVPVEYETAALALAGLILPNLVIYFRTWKTGKKTT